MAEAGLRRTGMRIAGALCLAAVAGSFFTRGDFASSLIMWVAINVLMTASFRFVLLIGELNFATAGFVGIGAYGAGLATTAWSMPLAVSLLLGAAAAGLASLVFGFVTLRAKGPYFLLISFAFTGKSRPPSRVRPFRRRSRDSEEGDPLTLTRYVFATPPGRIRA